MAEIDPNSINEDDSESFNSNNDNRTNFKPFVDHLSIKVPLNAYKISYGPLLNRPQDQLFVGRDSFIRDFTSTLRNSQFGNGSYLVSGYRGVGKTKAVEKGLDDYIKGDSNELPEWIKRFSDYSSEKLPKSIKLFYEFLRGIFLYLINLIKPKKQPVRPSSQEQTSTSKDKFQQTNSKNNASKFANTVRLWQEKIIKKISLPSIAIFLKTQWAKTNKYISQKLTKAKDIFFLKRFSAFDLLKNESFIDGCKKRLETDKNIFTTQKDDTKKSGETFDSFEKFDPYQSTVKWLANVLFWPTLILFIFPYSWLFLLAFVFALRISIAQHFWLRHGIDHIQFLKWLRTIIRPVIIVKVNLSFQPLRPNKILFNIVSLLRDELQSCIKHIFRRILYWVGVILVATQISYLQFNFFEQFHNDVSKQFNKILVCKQKTILTKNYAFRDCSILQDIATPFNKMGNSILTSLKKEADRLLPKLSKEAPNLLIPDNWWAGPILWLEFSVSLILHFFFFGISGNESIYFVFVYGFWIFLIDFLNTWILPTEYRVLRKINKLYQRIIYTQQYEGQAGPQWFSLKWSRAQLPLDERQLEDELLKILEDCRDVFIPIFFIRPDIIFVFDELDKIAKDDIKNEKEKKKSQEISTEIYERKCEIDILLGTLKNLITLGQARFIFIAGREMLDGWYADQDASSMLYESLFTRVFEIPSLLSDDSDHLGGSRLDNMIEVYVCRRLMEIETARYLWRENTRDAYIQRECENQYQDFIRNKKALSYEELMRLYGGVFEQEQTHNEVFKEAELNDPNLIYRPFQLSTYYRYLLATGFDETPELREDARYIILTLRHFIFYLTFHTWGNLKRLNTAFEEFVHAFESKILKGRLGVPAIRSTTRFLLEIGFVDHQRILLAANIYIPLQHQLGRRLSAGDDKLKITAFGALRYILKFHRRGFSRRYLERMIEAINIHSSPHLNDIIFSLMGVVLKPFARNIRNGFLRYRFLSGFEREIHYITNISDLESSSYSFSMAASENVKQHYKSLISEGNSGEFDEEELHSSSVLRGILGNFYFFEDNFDQAAEHFRRTLLICQKNVNKPGPKSDVNDLNIFLITALKLGNLHERRHNYKASMMVYESACQVISDWVHKDKVSVNYKTKEGKTLLDYIKAGDSKWNILLQPFICRSYLALKHGPGDSNLKISYHKSIEKAIEDKPANWIRRGRLAFLLNQFPDACDHFMKAYRYSNANSENKLKESNGLWSAISLYSVAECLLVWKMKELVKKFNDSNDTLEKDLSIYLREFTSFLENRNELNFDTNNNSKNNLKKLIQYDQIIAQLFTTDQKTFKNITSEGPLEAFNFNHILALLIKSGEEFHRLDLAYYETHTYFKILSLWTMLLDMLPRRKILNTQANPIINTLVKAEPWIKEIQERAWDGTSRLYDGAFGVFLLRYLNRDLLGNSYSILQNGEPINSGSTIPFIPDAVRKPLKHLFNPSKRRQEAAFWFRSLMGQNILITSLWENNFRKNLLRDHAEATRESSNNEDLSKYLPTRLVNVYMPPYSAQNRALALWLDGRFLCQKIRDQITVYEENSTENTPDQICWRNATKAVRNFYWAAQTVQLISGNSQGLMIVPKYLIYFNLWELLHDFIQFLMKSKGLSFEKAEKMFRGVISSMLWRKVPGEFVDYEYVKKRAIRFFKETEINGDPTNKARRDVLKTKYYIDDDFEDPHFLMEWTMHQMYSPAAYIHRRTIEESKFEVNEDVT